MNTTTLKKLPIADRIRLVEDLWDSIASEQGNVPLTPEQSALIDQRLKAFEIDGDLGRPAEEVIGGIRKRI